MDDGYDDKYPNYDKVSENLRNYIKNGKTKIRDLKKQAEVTRKNEEKLIKIGAKEEKKSNLRSEYDFFCVQIREKISFS